MRARDRALGLPRNLRVGASILAILAAVALAAPWIATSRPLLARGAVTILAAPLPHDPNRNDLDALLEAPSRAHPMGTDNLGRDLAARVVHGSRISLAVGLWTALLSLAVGVPLGAVAGYRGGWPDSAVCRILEAVLCIPSLLVALALLAAGPRWLYGLSDPIRMAVVLAITGWTPASRYIRGEFLRLRASDVVASARSSGAGQVRIALRHILPAALTPVLVTAAFSVGSAILLEATLSFLGLGIAPPTATWGGLLRDAHQRGESAWWLTVFPGACLFLSVLACNLVGEGLRDLLDPAVRSMSPNPRFVRNLAILLAIVAVVVWTVTRWVAIPWVVAGTSMEPTLLAGDRVLVDLETYRRRAPRPGEVVLLRGPGDRMLVKRVDSGPVPVDLIPVRPAFPARDATEEWFSVIGDHRSVSEDSRRFGPVPRDRFIGRVVWRYWPLERAGSIR